jgi:hypothetical protein
MTNENILSHLQDRAVRAHYWISFSPEKRGEQMIKDYSEELSGDIEELRKEGISEEQITDYKSRYERYFCAYLNAKSATFSAMITGPAKFPTRRHEKANRGERRHYEVFIEWRDRAKKAIVRKSKPPKTFLSEIDRYKNELESCRKNHDLMKEGNKRIAAARKSGEDISQYLKDTFNIAPHMIDWTLKFGFGLANNSANMRRIEDRIKLMEIKEAKSNTDGEKEFPFDGGKVLYNYEADRIQIKHDQKPAYEVISSLKSNGFKWSPFNQAWQRQLNSNGICAAKRVLKIELPY